MARRLPPFRPLALLFFVPLLLAPPCAAQQLPDRRVIDIAAPDGTKLMATYFAAGKPGPGVLLLHQCNRQRKVWDTLAEQLAAAGINVLTFDLRGFGESGGDRFDKLPPQEAQASAAKWPGDIDIAFQYLLSQPGVSHSVLGVGGASCGVNNAIQTARRHPEVKSLVLLSGNTDVAGRQFLHSAKNLPVLFAVADDDEFAPTVQAIEWLYDLAPNPGKKLAHYSTGGHGADIFPVHPDLPAAIVDWYVTTLIKTPGRAPAIANPPSMPQDVKTLEVIDQPGGAAKVSQMLQEARRRDAKATLFSEAIVNSMGYEHLRAGDTKGAIEILKLNASAYPDSPNVYDSLSDAYLADGQKDLARQNAKKALQLLPSDTFDPEARRQNIKDSAEQKLKQLGDPPQ